MRTTIISPRVAIEFLFTFLFFLLLFLLLLPNENSHLVYLCISSLEEIHDERHWGDRERERKPSRYQLYFSTNLFWTVLGQSRARQWSLELNSHHAEYSLRVDQRSKATKFFLSLLSFFHFDARIFRISTCFTAMAVHQEYESLLERGANVLSILSSQCPTSMENYFSGRESSCDLVAPLRLKSTRAPRFLERIGQRRREASRSRCESSLQPRNISAENKNVCFFLPPLIFLFVFQLNRQLVPTILDEIDRNSGYFYQDGSLCKI